MILEIVGIVLLLCFCFVVFFGAPYLPTMRPQIRAALELADLQPGETLLELGCGDGRVLVAAARQGIHAVGYELNPLLVLFCLARTWRYHKLVTVKWGNFFSQDWPRADAIFVFGLDKVMQKLDTKIVQQQKLWRSNANTHTKKTQPPLNLVSFAFEVPNKQPIREQAGIFLYEYK